MGEVAPAGTYTVRWSDMDRNGHMNNTHYPDLALDFVPAARMGQTPALIDLHFAGESRHGDTIAVSCGEAEGVCTVVGDTDRGRTFAARLTWGEADGL